MAHLGLESEVSHVKGPTVPILYGGLLAQWGTAAPYDEDFRTPRPTAP